MGGETATSHRAVPVTRGVTGVEGDGWVTQLGTRADAVAITAMYRRNGFAAAQGDPGLAGFYFTSLRAAGGEELVAVEGSESAGSGEVVGHLELLLCSEAPPLGRYGHVTTLEVREDRRRRGIGRTLLAHAARHCQVHRAAEGEWRRRASSAGSLVRTRRLGGRSPHATQRSGSAAAGGTRGRGSGAGGGGSGRSGGRRGRGPAARAPAT